MPPIKTKKKKGEQVKIIVKSNIFNMPQKKGRLINMKNEFEDKILKAMVKFEGKEVKVTLSGIIAGEFDISKLSYELEDEILEIRDNKGNYISIYLEDIERLYGETIESGYALLVFQLETDLEVQLQTKGERVIFIKDRIIEKIKQNGIFDDFLEKEAYGT